MAKIVNKNAIGAVSIPGITPEIEVTMLNPNKPLIVTSLNSEGPIEPEELDKAHTKSLKKLFEYAKPSIDVQLDTGDENNPQEDINVEYRSIKDFRPDQLVDRIDILGNLKVKEDALKALMGKISGSKKFQEVLNDQEKKEALISILETIVEELESQ